MFPYFRILCSVWPWILADQIKSRYCNFSIHRKYISFLLCPFFICLLFLHCYPFHTSAHFQLYIFAHIFQLYSFPIPAICQCSYTSIFICFLSYYFTISCHLVLHVLFPPNFCIIDIWTLKMWTVIYLYFKYFNTLNCSLTRFASTSIEWWKKPPTGAAPASLCPRAGASWIVSPHHSLMPFCYLLLDSIT